MDTHGTSYYRLVTSLDRVTESPSVNSLCVKTRELFFSTGETRHTQANQPECVEAHKPTVPLFSFGYIPPSDIETISGLHTSDSLLVD